jgi:translocation and assembly module TamA
LRARAARAVPVGVPANRAVLLRLLRALATVATLAFVCMSGAAYAQQQPQHYRLSIVAPDELADALRSQTLLGRWQSDPLFEPDQLALFIVRAREEAEAIAHAAGFFSAQVRVDQRLGDDQVPEVSIEVDAGARTTVSRLDLRIDGHAGGTPLAATLVQGWPLPEGSFFRAGEWELGKRQLLELLGQQGYARARIASSRADVDPQTTAAALAVSVDSGPRLVFGALNVRGLQRYPRSVVEALRPFDAGDPYTFDALLAFQQRLRASGYFLGVNVVPDLVSVETDPQRTDIPVNVDLTERRAQRVNLGVGFSTDQGPRALVGYEHRNLFERGWQLDTGLLQESVRRRAFATLRTPYDTDGHQWQAGARLEHLQVTGEITDKTTVFAGRGKRTEEIESFVSLQYQTERRRVDVGSDYAEDQRAALSLGYSWNLRRLDSRVDPRRGYTISTQVSAAVKGLGSDRSFTRLYGRAMRFWPMPQDSRLAGGVLIGLVEAGVVLSGSRDDIPSENLFRAGGAQSIRGYRFLGLGVREGEAIVGGRVMALGSLEYQHRITGPWYGAVFYDRGNAADRWSDFRSVAGYGAGVRWRSPIGPVNLDLAWGDAERRMRVHFSVGYSF